MGYQSWMVSESADMLKDISQKVLDKRRIQGSISIWTQEDSFHVLEVLLVLLFD